MNPVHDLVAHPVATPDHAAVARGLVSSAWHGLWDLALSSPWVAIGVMVPAVALLVGCTRATLHRD